MFGKKQSMGGQGFCLASELAMAGT